MKVYEYSPQSASELVLTSASSSGQLMFFVASNVLTTKGDSKGGSVAELRVKSKQASTTVNLKAVVWVETIVG